TSERGRLPPVACTPRRSPARIGRRTSAAVSGIAVVVAASEPTREAPRYAAGCTPTPDVSVLSDQCTNTPVKGAVGDAKDASQHDGALPSGVWPRSAPNVTAARAPAGTSSSAQSRASGN